MWTNVVAIGDFVNEAGIFDRLDAESTNPRVLKAEAALSELSGRQLKGEIAQYKNAAVVLKEAIGNREVIPYVSIDDVDLQDGCIFIDEVAIDDLPSRAKYVTKEGDVLVSNVRPNRGCVAYIGADLAGLVASSGFTLLRTAGSYSPRLLFAFLRTKWARAQLIRRNRGSMYPAVLAEDVYDIVVPEISDTIANDVDALIESSETNHDAFRRLQAKNRDFIDQLFAEKGISPPPSPLKGPSSGISGAVVDSSSMLAEDGPDRCDAEFFRPEYEEFQRAMGKAFKCFRLGEYYYGAAGRAQGKPVEQVAFIRQGALTNAGMNWSAVEFEEGDPRPLRGRVQAGDILLACTAHEVFYVGRKVDYVRSVPDEYKKKNCCVADIIVFRERDDGQKPFDGSYVAAFLRSDWGLHQVQRCIRGLRGGHIYAQDLEKYVMIPLPSVGWLSQFAENTKQAEAHKNLAKDNVLEAESLVDDYVAKAVGFDLDDLVLD